MPNFTGKKPFSPLFRAGAGARAGAVRPDDARDSLRRIPRVLATAVSFALYGLLALSLGLVGIPLQRLLRRSTDPQLDAQRLIHRVMRMWLRVSEAIGACRVSFTNPERLAERPLLVVANHPSLPDSPFLTSQLPEADFVVSRGWTNHPVLRRAIRGAGYLHEGSATALIREAVARLRAGRRVVMYPEGSRSPREGLGEFHRGVAHVALRAGCDVLPVVIRVHPRTLMKGQTFLDMPAGIPEWRFEVGEPWRPSDTLLPGETRSSAVRRVTAELRDYFEKRVERG